MKNAFRKLGLVALAGVVTALTACGDPVTDIDRTQPNRVAKAIFEDSEWYSRATVVDKQFHTTFPFIGFEDGLDRVRWEITQTRLFAYRSYERVPGSTGGEAGEQHVIAVFPIMMHFDVTRAYNPVNGVEQNILIENTFDRPWWEREFMRVNWSRNLVDDFTIAGFVQSLSPMKVTRNANADPANPWKVRFEGLRR